MINFFLLYHLHRISGVWCLLLFTPFSGAEGHSGYHLFKVHDKSTTTVSPGALSSEYEYPRYKRYCTSPRDSMGVWTRSHS